MGKKTSTPMVHDEWGPSRHPALCKCPAYKSKSGDNVHNTLGTWKHDQSYELWISYKHDINPKIDYCEHYVDSENLLYALVGEEISWKEEGKKQTYAIKSSDIDQVCMGVSQLIAFHKWLMAKHPDEVFTDNCEVLMPLKNLGLKKGGTPDIMFIGQTVAACLDYKYGMKIVSPWSEQLKTYLSGVMADNPFVDWTLYSGIIQPTVREDKAWVVEISQEHIERHANMMIDIIQIAKTPNPPRCPNSYCVYCTEFEGCPAVAVRTALGLTEMKSIDLETVPIDTLGDMFTAYGELKQLIGTAEKNMVLRLKDGEPSENWELVEGARRRVWTDEGEAVDVLQAICKDKDIDPSDLYQMKFVSVSQAEKLVGKAKATREAMQNVIIKKHGSLKLGRKKDG